MPRTKYTPDVLAAAAANADSVTDVLRALQLPVAGGTHALISRRLAEFGIDTSHFTRRKRHLARTPRGNPLDLLTVRHEGAPRINGQRLRVAMLAAGVPHTCKSCGLGSTWNGSPLQLQVDHVNGNPLDNRLANPRFLCPNCHSQCPTFSMRRSGRSRGSQPI